MAKGGWVYIMTNRPRGVLYIGVTASLSHRAYQHRHGRGSVFTAKYKLRRLVYAEQHGDIHSAISREKALKAWQREWKLRLVESINPDWRDLFDDLVAI